MENQNLSNKPIIEHIPEFLLHCQQEGLKEKSLENYQRLLNKFITWSKIFSFDNLLPHQLHISHINAYKTYLQNNLDKNGKVLKTYKPELLFNRFKSLFGLFCGKRHRGFTTPRQNIPS